MLVGPLVYLKQGNFDLQTGKPLGYTFQTTNCAECCASAVNLFGRNGGFASTWDLSGDGSSKPLNPTMRPGCYTTIIPAGGIVMMPPLQRRLHLRPHDSDYHHLAAEGVTRHEDRTTLLFALLSVALRRDVRSCRCAAGFRRTPQPKTGPRG